MAPAIIDQEFLRSSNEDDLLYELYIYVCNLLAPFDKLPYTRQDERNLLLTLPIGLRSLYLLTVLQSEVCNGGFMALINHGHIFHAKEMKEALELVGSTEYLAIFRRFMLLYNEILAKHPVLQRFVLIGLGPNRFTPDESELIARCWEDFGSRYAAEEEGLTSDFYRATEDFGALELAHVRSYPSLYYHP